MPKIAIYNASEQLRVPGGGLATASAFGGGTGAAGQAISQVADYFQQRAERDQVNDINISMAKVRGEWIDHVTRKSEEAGAGAPNFTKNIVEEYDAAMEKMRGERSLPRHIADRLIAEQEQFKTQLIGRATTFEASARAAKRKNDAIEYQTGISRTVFNDPAMFKTELDRIDETLSGFGLTGDALTEMSRAMKVDLAQNTVRGLINRGQLDLAREALKSGPISEFVSGDLAAQLTGGIEQEQRRLDAESERASKAARDAMRSQVSMRFDDEMAAIEATGKPTGLLSEKLIRQAYADDPDQATYRIGKLRMATAYYATRASAANTTVEQDDAVVASLREKVTGPNAGLAARYLSDYSRITEAKVENNLNAIEASVKRDLKSAEDSDQFWTTRGRATVQRYMDDELASITLTGKRSGLFTDDNIRRAFRDDPQMAEDILRRVDTAIRYNALRSKVGATTPEQDKEVLATILTGAEGANSADGFRQYQDYVKAVTEKRRAYAEDPGGAAAQYNPELQTLLQKAGSDHEAFKSAMALTRKIQMDQGVPAHDVSYLGNVQAAAVVNRLNKMDPEQAANEIENMRRQYGPLFPNVVEELRVAKMSPTFVTLARMDRPEDSVPRANLATANQIGADTMKKTLGETRAKAVHDKVLSAMEDYAPVLSRQGTYANRVLAADVQSVNNLALFYAQQGESEGRAAQRAYDEVIGSRYDFDKTWLAPKGLGSKARDTADAIISNLAPSDFAPERGGDPALSDDYRRNAAYQEAVRNGTWVNTPGGDGLMLISPRGPIRKADGSPIQFMFKDAGTVERRPPADLGAAVP